VTTGFPGSLLKWMIPLVLDSGLISPLEEKEAPKSLSLLPTMPPSLQVIVLTITSSLGFLSRLHREKGIQTPPDPRRQFILDLQSWLEFLKSDGTILRTHARSRAVKPNSHHLVVTFNKKTLTICHQVNNNSSHKI
jgi:hypothetical protein